MIDVIRKILTHGIIVAIATEVASQSIATSKFGKEMRSLQNVDVIERPWQPEESMLNPQVLRCKSFKHSCWITVMASVHPVPARQFFHL
jgi:hypothetical protein